MMEKIEAALYWASWAIVMVFASVLTLLFVFGCLLYYWTP